MQEPEIAKYPWAKLVPELSVSDFNQSRDFYSSIGFHIIFQRQDPRFAYLDFEGAQIMIEEIQPNYPGWETASLERPFGRGINLQIECQDITVLLNQIQSLGYHLFRPLKETWYQVSETDEEGQKELLIQDPDGYLLRFSQPLGRKTSV